MNMVDEIRTAAPVAGAENLDLRRQLIKRLTMAGGLVALLLALLALFDHLSQPAEEVEMPEFTETVPVAPKKVLTQPVSAPPDEPGDAAETAETASAETALAEEAPPPPVVAATPEPSPLAEQPPAGAPRRPVDRKAAAEMVVPEVTAAPPILVEPAARPQPRERIENRGESTAVTSRPARVVEVTPPPVRPARQVEGFLLQAGVFTSAERAEELHAKLTLNGIPTQVETRVQVGPFHTRQEALAAQAKLKALGIDSLLVMPKGTR